MTTAGTGLGSRSSKEALIDLDAVAHNTRVLARIADPAALMAVVKADGFGHGAVPVARTALRHGATWLGVASPAEALALRASGITAPVLVWLYVPGDDLTDLVRAEVDLSVSSAAQLSTIVSAAARSGLRARIHLKVDTGLARGGATLDEWPHLIRAARLHERSAAVVVRGIWSHLAGADLDGDPSVAKQTANFEYASDLARAVGLTTPLRHLANSAALLAHRGTGYDLVRAGIALYGVEPLAGRSHGLRAAMTVRAEVIDRTTALAVLPIGFADGVPRRTAGRAEVLLHGTRCRVRQVALDQIVVDAGDLPVVRGDTAVIFGPGDAGEPTVEDWAGWADTNPHEILTGIGAKVPRRVFRV